MKFLYKNEMTMEQMMMDEYTPAFVPQMLIKGMSYEQVQDGDYTMAVIHIDEREDFKYYFWPERDMCLGSEKVELFAQHGPSFALGFVTLAYQDTAYTFISDSDFAAAALRRDERGIEIRFWYDKKIPDLCIEVHKHQPDWRMGVMIYKAWLNEKIGICESMNTSVLNKHSAEKTCQHAKRKTATQECFGEGIQTDTNVSVVLYVNENQQPVEIYLRPEQLMALVMAQ